MIGPEELPIRSRWQHDAVPAWRPVAPTAAGTLKEWHWRALAKAYAAGDEGLEGEYGVYANIRERTWQRLLEYKRGVLVEERPRRHLGHPARRMHITANGRALYVSEWAR